MTTISSLAVATTLYVPITSYGFSEEAELLRQTWGQLYAERTPTSLFAVHQQLQAICEAASAPNWDGEGAAAVEFATCERAQRFLDAIPSSFPEPEIAVDPDGDVSFEWSLGRRRVLSVSVGNAYEIAYAALFGTVQAHGTEFFIDELPQTVMDNLRRLYGKR